MPAIPSFVGGTYQALFPIASADMAVNVMLETRRDTEQSTKSKWLVGTPGLKLFSTATDQRCRGWFYQDNLTLVVFGTTLFIVNIATATLTAVTGIIPDNGEPVSYASNGLGGDQVAIVGGGSLFILNTTTLTLTAVTLPFADPVMVVFIDAYFLANQRNSPIFWFSALEDGTNWDALDFVTRSGTSDNLVGLGVSKNIVWVWGTKSTTLFYNSGDADTPFLPYPQTVAQIGAVTPWAIMQRGDVFTWLAQDATSTPTIVQAKGDPSAAVISTPPIEKFLRGCVSLASAEALVYEQDGHYFYVLTCPESPDDVQTYAWDDTEHLWHARAGWDNGSFTRWRARGSVAIGTRIFVGDYENGNLYTLDLETYADNGAILKRLRRVTSVSSENQWLFVDELELMAEEGVGLATGQGSAPVVDLRISRNAARSWISAGSSSLGAIGDAVARAIWHRLGRVRADRFGIEISQTDPVRTCWTGLQTRITNGTGEL